MRMICCRWNWLLLLMIVIVCCWFRFCWSVWCVMIVVVRWIFIRLCWLFVVMVRLVIVSVLFVFLNVLLSEVICWLMWCFIRFMLSFFCCCVLIFLRLRFIVRFMLSCWLCVVVIFFLSEFGRWLIVCLCWFCFDLLGLNLGFVICIGCLVKVLFLLIVNSVKICYLIEFFFVILCLFEVLIMEVVMKCCSFCYYVCNIVLVILGLYVIFMLVVLSFVVGVESVRNVILDNDIVMIFFN